MANQLDPLWVPEDAKKEGLHDSSSPPEEPEAGRNSNSAGKPFQIWPMALESNEAIFVSCIRAIPTPFLFIILATDFFLMLLFNPLTFQDMMFIKNKNNTKK